MKDLEHKVIWITGASSGIGEALVYELQRHNPRLILSARRTDQLQRVRENCEKSVQENIRILPLDLAKSGDLPSKAKEAEMIFGRIDILINNGGISQRDSVLNTSMEVDREIMEVNYFGSIALSKYLMQGMLERGEGHHVIISSAVGIVSTPKRSGYAASKHALHGFYDALRAEHHQDNIPVTMICPGYIQTNISYNARMGDGSVQNKLDDGQANGIPADKCARKIVKAIQREKEEVYIGGAKELFGIYVKRFLPGLYSKLVTKMKVT